MRIPIKLLLSPFRGGQGCQRVIKKGNVSKQGTSPFFIVYIPKIFSFVYAAFFSFIWKQVAIFQLYGVINRPININLAALAHIFLILKYS